MDPIDLATTYHQQGFSCSQSIVLAFAGQFGLERDMAARISAAFGGGMGRAGRTCGAVTGALMVIGLYQGAVSPGNKTSKDQTYTLARQFQQEFQARSGALDCSALLGIDISSPEGYMQARQENRFSPCYGYIEEAARILKELMNELI
jgi:C_GCAxxG_C_C family probable redox protein